MTASSMLIDSKLTTVEISFFMARREVKRDSCQCFQIKFLMIRQLQKSVANMVLSYKG